MRPTSARDTRPRWIEVEAQQQPGTWHWTMRPQAHGAGALIDGARELMRLHVEALFTRDAGGRLLAVNDGSAAPAPRFFLGRTAEGNLWWFRHDVDDDLASDLEALCKAETAGFDVTPDPEKDAPFVARMSREAPIRKRWAGPVFVVPATYPGTTAVLVTSDNAAALSPYLKAWHGDVATCRPMIVVLEGASAVAVCASVRITPQAHEAGVETHPDFRNRGYAAQAALAWANAVRERGCIPLYSTSWSNDASRGLARKLGLPQFGSDLHIT